MKLTLTYIGRDDWDRPVYEADGRLYVDVDPRAGRAPNICTKINNEFHGEPDTPISVMTKLLTSRSSLSLAATHGREQIRIEASSYPPRLLGCRQVLRAA